MGQSNWALWLLQKTFGSQDLRRTEEDVEVAQDLAPEVAQETMAQALMGHRMNHRVEHPEKLMDEEEMEATEAPTKQLAKRQPHPPRSTGMKEVDESGESFCLLALVDAYERQGGVQEEEESEASLALAHPAHFHREGRQRLA